MQKIQGGVLAFAFMLFITPVIAQNVAINADGSLPDPNAILDIKSSTKGILIPRISSPARLSMATTRGLLVYDTTTNSFWYYNSYKWLVLTTGTNAIRNGSNTATGDSALYSNGGWSNTANGYNALFSNISGNGITAIGSYSLRSNTTGNENTACGASSMFDNTTGSYNTATGAGSLYYNTTGRNNVANGYSTLLFNRTGNDNTACGAFTLQYDTSGFANTAIGSSTMQRNIGGYYNTAVGHHTLATNSTGNCNTAIGVYADVNSETLTNATAIGYGAIVNASNKVRIGNSTVTVIEGQVPFTTPSDGRFKFNVQEDVKGLEFITQRRPVTYQFDVKRFDTQQSFVSTNNDVQWAGYNEATQMRRSGFIAQEVEKAALTSGYNFSGIIKPKTAEEYYGLSYESFVVPLVKAVQELKEENNGLKQKLEEQSYRQKEQDAKLASLQQQLDALQQLLPHTK